MSYTQPQGLSTWGHWVILALCPIILEDREEKMTKGELINKINDMPDDIDVFMTQEGQYNDINVKIFTKPKTKEFYDWYLFP